MPITLCAACDPRRTAANPRSPILTCPRWPLTKMLSHLRSLCITGGSWPCKYTSPFKIWRAQFLTALMSTRRYLCRYLNPNSCVDTHKWIFYKLNTSSNKPTVLLLRNKACHQYAMGFGNLDLLYKTIHKFSPAKNKKSKNFLEFWYFLDITYGQFSNQKLYINLITLKSISILLQFYFFKIFLLII